jgi:outer membrane protein TolC
MFKFLLPFLLVAPLWAASEIEITEKSLISLSKQGSPQLDEIEAAFLQSSLNEKQTDEKFAPELFAEGKYSETNEQAIIRFQPVFSPISQTQVGVKKDFSQGFNASASVVTDQRSAAPTSFTGRFNQVTTTTVKFTVQMDLWKNLFGRMDKAKLYNAALDSKRAKIQQEISTKTFELTLRRLYWSLVANQEALGISEVLLKASKEQLAEVNQRFKNSVAEADEVARNKAQVASREAAILGFRYQREDLIRQLKNFVPELSGKEIVIGDYDIQKTIDRVLACTATIATQPKTPYQYTKYDEIVGLLKEVKTNNRIINDRYAGPDVSLYGTAKTTGIGSDPVDSNGFRGSYGAAREDIENNNRTGYEVGLAVTIPLGSAKRDAAEVKRLYDDKRFEARIRESELQVENTHSALVKRIGYLTEVNRVQKVNSDELKKRLGFIRKKYKQARVSINDVILDQDAFLSSELTTIDTRLAILNTIFDYLTVFTDTPCELNRN